MEIVIREKKYKVLKDYGETISLINFDEIVTDFYDIYDYIVGDWAYGKVRLKGFYKKNHKNVKKHNNFENVDSYIENECAYGCKHFILEKVNESIVEKS